MSEWVECKLSQLIDTNLSSISNNYPYKLIKYLDTGSITKGKIESYQITDINDAPSRARRLVKHNDIIYSSVRPIQRHYGFIQNPDDNLVVSTGFVVITCKTIKAYPKFLYYVLSSDQSVEELDMLAEASTSTYPSLKPSDIENIELTIPSDTKEQKAIAAVLSSLDDKIDLLHRQNKTLEAMAETLFRQWFIEEAKDDWEEKPLADIVKVIDNRGKTPPYQEYPTAFPIIEVNALCNTNRMVNYSVIRKYVSEETYETWFRGHPKKYDILISTVGSIGELSMYLIDLGCVAQNVVALSPRGISPFYLYQSLYNLKGEIKELDIGSVQPSIKVPHLLSIMIKIPPLELLDNYDEQAKRFVSKITNNQIQIQTLEKLRDNLLPKLMSGEVRVSYEQQDAA